MNGFDAWLKHAVETRFSSLVAEKVSKVQNLDVSMIDSVGDDIAQVVYRSKEMNELRSELFHQDSEMNTQLLIRSPGSGRQLSHRNSSTCFSSSAEESLKDDSAEDFYPVSEKRVQCTSRNANDRLKAFELLLKVPISDIVCSASWPQLQQELCESLCDDNWNVFQQVLKVLARLSSSVSFGPVREGFISLLEGLTLYYLSRQLHQQLPSALHGVHLDSPVHQRIILISHCLLQVLEEGKWIRFGEKHVLDIVDNCVDLLSMHTHHHRSLSSDHNKSVLYPFHIFSILDPEAKWCLRITHAAFGRNILLKCILKSPSLIRFIIEEIVIWLDTQMKLSDGVTPVYEFGNNGNINGNMVNLTVFAHCISLLKLFVSCDRGHMMFPIPTSLQEEPISVYAILLKTLLFLNKVANDSRVSHSKKLLENLENICVALILCRGTRILQGSSMDLVHLLLEVPLGNDHFFLHSHNLRIFCQLTESQEATSWILGRHARRTRDGTSRAFNSFRPLLSSASSLGREGMVTNRASCVAKSIAKATASVLRDRNKLTSDTAQPICQLLALSEKLFSTPDGYTLLESCECKLVSLAGQLLIHIRNLMYISDLGLLSIQKSLEAFLLAMTQTPMGFLAVSNVEGLVGCLVMIFVESPMKENYHDPRFLHLLQLTSFHPNIQLQKNHNILMKNSLKVLWETGQVEDGWMWQEAVNQFLKIVLSIYSSPRVVSEMWNELVELDCSSESTLVQEVEPLSLKELLTRGLDCSGDDTPPHVEEVCRTILHSLSHNLDIALILQEKINLSECIQRNITNTKIKELGRDMSMLPSPRGDKANVVVDENVLLYHHIFNILQEIRDPVSHGLFPGTKYSCSSSPRSQIRTGRIRAQTDLQRFLQDTRYGLHDNTWISYARRVYRSSCRSELKVPVLIELLDQVLRARTPSVEAPFDWPSGETLSQPSQQHSAAIEMIIRYGCELKVLSPNIITQHVEQLSLLLHQARIFLNNKETADRFDWFVASVFLMCTGNLERCRCILQRVAMLSAGAFIWPLSSQSTVQQTAYINQHLQSILEEYATKSYHILLEAGVPGWLVAERLTCQAFLPVIPISQLPHILALAALHSWEYNIYMRAAILIHLEPRLLELSTHQPIQSLLAETRLEDFSIGDYLPFMDKMAKLNRLHHVKDRNSTATL